MKKFLKKLLLGCTLLATSLAYGQTGGVTTFSAADNHEFDSISLTTLIPTLKIPLLTKSAGPLPGSITLESPQTCHLVVITGSNGTSCGTTSTGRGMLAMFYFIPSELIGMTTDATFTGTTCKVFTVNNLIGADGLSSYSIPQTILHYPSGCGDGTLSSKTVITQDGSGLTATLTASGASMIVTSVNNTSGWINNTGSVVSDAFGNTINNGTSTFTDSLGAATTLGTSTQSYTYIDTNGANQTISFVNGSATTFQPIGPCGSKNAGNSVTPPTSISFPDGTSIGITWDTHNGGIDGLVKTITLRTGGTITYTYGSVLGCSPGFGYSTLNRTTSDGITQYSLSTTSNSATATVLDPGMNKIVYTFFGNDIVGNHTFLNTVTRYQNTGSVVSPVYTEISSTSYCYNTNSCGTAPTYPITQRDTYEYVYSGATQEQVSHRVELFDATYGLLTSDSNTELMTTPNQTITKTVVYGTLSGGNCVALGNTAIVDHPCTITVKNGTNQLSYKTYTYNSNGAPTTSTEWISSTDTLSTSYSPNSNGTIGSVTAPNGQVVTNTYGSGSGTTCGSSGKTLLLTDATTTVSGVVIDNKKSWDCNGAVVTDTTDPNSNEDDTTYDSMFRPLSHTDRNEQVTNYAYGYNYVKTTDPAGVVSYVYVDGLGRPTVSQTCQTSACSNLDTSSKSYAWNGTNFETKTYVPCVQTVLNTPCTTVALTADINPIVGPVSSTDANSGTLTWGFGFSSSGQDSSMTAGPAPPSENTKKVQTEKDGFGRVKSICATETSGGTPCGQALGNSGILTSSTYSFATGSSEVDTTRGSQTHKVVSDAIGRVTSATTPEAGTVTSYYDTIPNPQCYQSGVNESGFLTATKDNAGNYICPETDGIGRVYAVGASSFCKRFIYDSTASWSNPPSGYPSSGNNLVGRLVRAETDNCSAWPPTAITDEWFAYDKDGRTTDMWELVPGISGYTHTSVTYDADGTVTALSIPNFSFTFGTDGEDRPFNAQQGSTWLIGSSSTTGISYDAASRPLTVPIGTGSDSDVFTYDSVGNMKTYTYNINGQSMTGTLTWNSIGSLRQLAVNDGFNSGGTQTCTFGTASPVVMGYDDVGRLLDDNCGSSLWHQSYSYDQYDNLTKTGNPGISWNPGYSSTNNEMTGSSYDSNGNVTYDGVNSYSWNIYGKMASSNDNSNQQAVCGTSGQCAIYDALDRLVDAESSSGGYTARIYSPIGDLVAWQIGSDGHYEPRLSVPGGNIVYISPGQPVRMQHLDWLGSSRISSALSPSSVVGDWAISPYGDFYDKVTGYQVAQHFAGLDDIFDWTLFTTPNRILMPASGRWLSPDPAHASWNAYSYVTDPNTQTDRSGLGCEGGPLDPVDCQNTNQSAGNGPAGDMQAYGYNLGPDPFGPVNALLLAIEGLQNDIVNVTNGGINADEIGIGQAVAGVETLYNMPIEGVADGVFTLKTQFVRIPKDEPIVSAFHGSIDDATNVFENGYSAGHKSVFSANPGDVWVSRDLAAAENATSPGRMGAEIFAPSRFRFTDPDLDTGIIEHQIPEDLFNKHFLPDEKAYGRGRGFGGFKQSSSEIQIWNDTQRKILNDSPRTLLKYQYMFRTGKLPWE